MAYCNPYRTGQYNPYIIYGKSPGSWSLLTYLKHASLKLDHLPQETGGTLKQPLGNF